MANSFTADFAEIWSRVQQEQFFKQTVAVAIASTQAKSQMSSGDTFNKPYRSSNNLQSYVRGTSITIDDKTDTNEQLVVDQQFATGFYIDDMDSIQTDYNLIANYAKDDTALLNIQVDGDVLGEVANATSYVDDGTIGGTGGNPITVTTSNISNVFGAARRKIAKQNVPMNNLFAVISPEMEDILVQYGAGRDTSGADTVQNNGFIGKFYGFSLFMSNNLTGSVVLGMATEPTASDTVVIQGVTFTFVASPAAAGDIDLSATVDTTRGYLVNLINNPSTTSATQIALATADARAFANNVVAVDDATADTVTITYKGAGVLAVSETLTDATDAFTDETQHNLFGVKGAIDLVIQKSPTPMIKSVETKAGSNVLNTLLYGVKTFADGAKQLVDARINSVNF
uniref:Major capsid protein n=1 Tax=uncultured marine virus TaxID=186617 RepID=A0A0F7L5T2_9VIRU|nr:hypothetical protein [uncultured marine virus]